MEERKELQQVMGMRQQALRGLVVAASFAVLLSAETWAQAQAQTQTPVQTADRAEAIDMDAEVIERESKTSPLRLEIETSALDSTIYKRSDFNEFHAVDSAVRLKYLAAPLGDRERGAGK